MIAGIHFKGMDARRHPFIGVFAQSRWLGVDELRHAHSLLMERFAEFTPEASWWWTLPGTDLHDVPGVELDQHLVVGSLSEIQGSHAAGLPHGWNVRELASARDVAGSIDAMYREFHAERDDPREHVTIASIDDLQTCADEGGLFGCFDGQELAGLFAVRPGLTEHGLLAWMVWEIVLARPYCGQGLAPLFQREALGRLDSRRAPGFAIVRLARQASSRPMRSIPASTRSRGSAA